MTSETWAELRAQLRWWGGRAALAACILNGVWLACFVYLAHFGDTGTQVRAHAGVFRLSLGSCVLLTLLEVPVLLALVASALERAPARALVGGLFYAIYVPLNLSAYFTFGRLAPIVHATALPQDQALTSLIARQIEIGDTLAVSGILPILGYGVLGLGFCLLSPGLWGASRIQNGAAALLFASGAFSVAGAIGAFLCSAWLEKGSLLGGVVSLPAMALVAAALWRPMPAQPSVSHPEQPTAVLRAGRTAGSAPDVAP